MPAAVYAVRPGEPEHGVICPECGSPKTRQARRCSACYRDRRRAGLYPNPPILRREQKPNWKGGVSLRAPTGRSRGRPQPVDHPWRKAETLRLAKAAKAA